MEDERRTDKLSSIEVSKNTKGQYTFKVKIYFDDDNYDANKIADLTQMYFNTIESRFI